MDLLAGVAEQPAWTHGREGELLGGRGAVRGRGRYRGGGRPPLPSAALPWAQYLNQLGPDAREVHGGRQQGEQLLPGHFRLADVDGAKLVGVVLENETPEQACERLGLDEVVYSRTMRRLLKARELGLPEGDLSTLESDEVKVAP